MLITSHDAFNYFGRAFGLKVMGVQGITTESEAGLQRINELVDFIVKNNVQAVFVESSVSPKNIEALVDGAKARGKELKIGGELVLRRHGRGRHATKARTSACSITTSRLVARALGGEAPEAGFGGRLTHVK